MAVGLGSSIHTTHGSICAHLEERRTVGANKHGGHVLLVCADGLELCIIVPSTNEIQRQ